MQMLPFVAIMPEDVGMVYADQFDELNDRFEREIKRLSEDNAALMEKLAKDKQELHWQYAEMAKWHSSTGLAMGCAGVQLGMVVAAVGSLAASVVTSEIVVVGGVVVGGIIVAGKILGSAASALGGLMGL